MKQEMIRQILLDVREHQPLIHCITNSISINQCANAILAVGGRPIMAEHPMEVAEITCTAKALMLNLGNITDTRMESIRISAKTATENRIPILLDAVGVACSQLRRAYIHELLSKVTPTVIKGNYSEIHGLYQDSYRSTGVDAEDLDISDVSNAAVVLAREWNTIILASGKVDIVTDGKRLFHIRNGTPQLSTITGTGCMLGALCAIYLSAIPQLDAVITACAVLGISGEMARTDRGSGTFFVNLMDALSTLTAEDISKNIKMEEISLENI